MKIKKRYLRYLVKPVSFSRKLRVAWWNMKHVLKFWKHPLWGPFPTYAKIEIDQRCNLACIYCYRESGITSNKFMTYDRFKDVVDKLGPGLCEVWPHGFGEPMRNPMFFEMMSYLKEKGIMWGLSTNGTYLNQKTIPKLLELKPINIRISFDAGERERYERIRIGAHFDIVVENIKRLVSERDKMYPKGTKNRPLVSLYCVLSMNTLDQIEPMIALKEKIGADLLTFSDLAWNNDFKDSYKSNAIRQMLSYSQLKDMFKKYTRDGVSFTFTRNVDDIRECGYPKYHAYVHANGDFYPCTCVPGFEPPLFNIFTDVDDWKDLYKLYDNSLLFNDFRESSLTGQQKSLACKSCLQWGCDLIDVI